MWGLFHALWAAVASATNFPLLAADRWNPPLLGSAERLKQNSRFPIPIDPYLEIHAMNQVAIATLKEIILHHWLDPLAGTNGLALHWSFLHLFLLSNTSP
jgi:hypothetical protein